ncbi:hypothetical protein MO973_16060 [Paenibacillus sp. TRM 82003]|uniref:hypothetical protein n=1 Tax=Kineococcus sp. TRM81007 TaxID=2925831 RepID=UPI001F584C52|nr:hypothetical protein [Kineococcus sp. TRM81007]MCI2237727.1 hypothetical protein [Kineococcus sp. TRM81007]MCI3921745.1 hypothetical protein [Paenibacillus sp. TRM 82003]
MHTTDSTTRTARQGRRRRLAVLAGSGATALALGLSACGGQDEPASTGAVSTQLSAYEVVQASAERSSTAGSAKFAFTVDAAGGGESATVSGEGAFDAAEQEVRLDVSLPAAATGAAGGGGEVEVRLVEDTAYVSGAPLTGQGQWVRLPLDAAATAGVDTSTLDPSHQLEQLKAVADDVREVPATDVRGVQARGYAGSIDMVKALEQLPAEQRTAEAEQAAAEVGSVPFTLYVDEENRPVRLVVDAVGPEGATATVSMDYYDWGSDVDVTAPDPASVVELPAGQMPVQEGAAA